jgi:sigma-B regulation protein RsbU (phosphoserine phosphatase)
MKASVLEIQNPPVAATREPTPVKASEAPVEPQTLDGYLDHIVHDWLRTLTALGFTLIPAFYVLDMFMMPKELLPRFAVYRFVTEALVLAQFFIVRSTKPNRLSYLHGYFFSLVVGLMIVLMTTDLGGFHSTYYAGLNLVVIAVNLLLPWKEVHTAMTSMMIIGMYIVLNLIIPQHGPVQMNLLINNLYFLVSTAIIAVSITAVKHRLVVKEFLARQDLKEARDALWGEMEVAKHIQTALLPQVTRLGNYEVAAIMRPADEVGGDYYDVIQTRGGENWVSIGDVSGHGVESGLVMMMAQTSLLTTVSGVIGQPPSKVLSMVNTVIKENIERLRTDRYMTMTAFRLDPDRIVYSGQHQDLLVHRAATREVEVIISRGTWLGIVDNLDGLLSDAELKLAPGDILLLYTDGVTEASNAAGEMFGDARLKDAMARHAHNDVGRLVERLADEVLRYTARQDDDVTLVAVRRI